MDMVNKLYDIEAIYNRLMERIDTIDEYNPLVVICIGTDKVKFDNIGPLIGSILSYELEHDMKHLKKYIHVVGKIKNTCNATNLIAKNHLVRQLYPDSFVIGIDACVTDSQYNDLYGTILYKERGISPGLGVNKNLPKIGDASLNIINCCKNGHFDYNLWPMIDDKLRNELINKVVKLIFRVVEDKVSELNNKYEENLIWDY